MAIEQKVIENLREDYRAKSLDQKDILENPMDQFDIWFQEAMDAALKEPNAMTLATSTTGGLPSARIMLLKGFDQKGFVFYTNYESRKGQELINNPHAALVFSWLELQRQVRIEGTVRQLSAELSERYFQSRPKGSQIGAWASPQSKVVTSRKVLEEKLELLEEQYKNETQLPRPEHWGGFVVVPHYIEFWQGRTSRMHDRMAYRLEEGGSWRVDRLAP